MTQDTLPELPAGAFAREDEGDDLAFYAPPRLVTHIDEAAVAALSARYPPASKTSWSIIATSSATAPAEKARATTLQHTLSWLMRAREVSGQTGAGGDAGTSADPAPAASAPMPAPPSGETADTNVITYKILDDVGDRLKNRARAACNFWNRFVAPTCSIVIRLGTFTHPGNTIAYARKPYENDGVRYGEVKFNTRYLLAYTPDGVAGTIIHAMAGRCGTVCSIAIPAVSPSRRLPASPRCGRWRSSVTAATAPRWHIGTRRCSIAS